MSTDGQQRLGRASAPSCSQTTTSSLHQPRRCIVRQAMSLLADRRRHAEDYPEAAKKHLEDATALACTQRHDGCSYLAGYVVECSLRSVFLHEESWDPTARQHIPRKLHAALDRRPVSHDLQDLLMELKRVTAAATALSAKYVPPPPVTMVPRWSASLRYRAPHVTARDSQAMLAEAKRVYDHTIGQMRLDGVL